MGSLGMRFISSDKDTQFDSTLAQHAIESESIDMPTDWQTAGIYKCVISELAVQSTQGGLDLELIFWRTAGFDDADMDLSKVISRIALPEGSDTLQIASANQFYYKNPLVQSIEYVDEDHSSKIHVSLVNRDATKKNTAASGTIQLTAGTAGSEISSVTVGGVTITSAAVPFNVSIDQTMADLETNIDAFTGTSGWTSDTVTDTCTITASSDDKLGEVSNDLEIVVTVTGDFATTDVDPTGALGDVVLTLGCTPYFS